MQSSSTEPSLSLIDAHLARKAAPLNLITPLVREMTPRAERAGIYRSALPVRPPSALPPPGNAHLTGKLGQFLGDGRTGIVFTLKDVLVDDQPCPALPALAVKIARANRVASLAREAWFYDDMEHLQGVAIPRCYGWFEVDLADSTFPAWTAHPTDGEDYDVAVDIDRPDSVDGFVHPDLLERGRRRDILSVLVLERLGKRMTALRPVSDSDRKDIMALYTDMGHLGIQVCDDIRWQNVLAAPDPPCLPSLPSPTLGHPHKWRAIDFELAMKTNYSDKMLRRNYSQWVNTMMRWVENEGPSYDEREVRRVAVSHQRVPRKTRRAPYTIGRRPVTRSSHKA